MANRKFNEVPTKGTIVPADEVVLVDSEDSLKLKRVSATVFKGEKGDTGDVGPAGANGADGVDGVVQSIVAGTNISVDSTDPANPVVSVANVGSANGIASLDATTKVPKEQLASGTPDNTKFLRGDGVWSVPSGSGAGIGSLTFFKEDGTQDDIDLVAATALTNLSVSSQFSMDSAADFYVGNSLGWRDLMGPIESRGTGGPSWTLFRNGIYLYAFPSNSSKEAFVAFHLDHDYAPGTKVYPHIHYTVNTTNWGVVRWGIEYTVAKGHAQASGSIFSATTTVYVNQTITAWWADQYKHFVAEVSDADAIPSTFCEPDTVILVRIFRDTANPADTFPDDVFGFQADCHYQISKFATKNKAPNFYV